MSLKVFWILLLTLLSLVLPSQALDLFDGESQENFMNVSTVFRQVSDHMKKYSLPNAPKDKIDLFSFTPFCKGFSKPRAGAAIAAECLAWEVS